MITNFWQEEGNPMPRATHLTPFKLILLEKELTKLMGIQPHISLTGSVKDLQLHPEEIYTSKWILSF